MTTLSVTTVLLLLVGLLTRGGYPKALALGGATAAGAAVVVGGTAVPTFYAVALGSVIALTIGLLRPRNPDLATTRGRLPLPPAVSLLVVFFGWSVFVTLTAPIFFDGQPVRAPGNVAARLSSGYLSSSNVAQMIYLFLGVCVVCFLARARQAGPAVLGLGVATTTLLSLWRYLHTTAGVPFPENFFDNSPSFAYIETAPRDVQRFRGILSEPAGLAVSCLVTIAYMLPRSSQLQGVRRFGALSLVAVAVFLGIVSTSATFVVAGAIVAAIAGGAFATGFVLRRVSMSTAISLLGCVVVVVALWVLPVVADFVEAIVNEKISSSSFDQRSTSDSISYEIVVETFGFGVGLGSNRSSSFLPGLLSATGLLGTALFVTAVATLLYRSAAVRAYRPVVWALVSLLVVKVVSGPDLSDSSGVLWISLGLLSRAALEAHATGKDRSRSAVAAIPTAVHAAPPILDRPDAAVRHTIPPRQVWTHHERCRTHHPD